MRSLKVLGLASAVVLMAGVAQAAPIVLDFEGIGNRAWVNDFYNGGTDSAGNSGPDYGIGFSLPGRGLIDTDAGGTGYFANEPSPDTALYFQDDDAATLSFAATMNVAAGFDTGLSFFYASVFDSSVTVYDGLNGTGNVLATLALAALDFDCSGDPIGSYCAWAPVGITFAGTARSVEFAGRAGSIVFDNITLGSATPGQGGTSVPEPATLALLGVGLAGLGLIRRRRRTD